MLTNGDLIKKLFKPTGALGAFEAKADLGFLMKIYDTDTHADICDLASIRNLFAHIRKPLQFDSRDIRPKIEGFRLVKRSVYPKIPGKGLPDADRSPPRLDENASLRDKLMLTVKLLAIVFWAASHDLIMGQDGHVPSWIQRGLDT